MLVVNIVKGIVIAYVAIKLGGIAIAWLREGLKYLKPNHYRDED